MCSALVSCCFGSCIKDEVFRLYIKEDSSHDVCLEIQIPIVNQSTDYFSFVPMVPMVPIDHSFSHGLQVS